LLAKQQGVKNGKEAICVGFPGKCKTSSAKEGASFVYEISM